MATPKTNWTDIEIDTEGDSSIEDIVLELSNEEPKRTEVKKAETPISVVLPENKK
jgi:hypothetical protein